MPHSTLVSVGGEDLIVGISDHADAQRFPHPEAPSTLLSCCVMQLKSRVLDTSFCARTCSLAPKHCKTVLAYLFSSYT